MANDNPEIQTRYHVVVEGNIAVGKTTFMKHLQSKLNNKAEILLEPLGKWTNLKGANLLQDMYANPTQRSFHAQTYIQLTMAINQQTPANKPIKIMERSLESGQFVFIKTMLEEGHIDQTESDILDEWYNWLQSRNPPVHEIIYLRSTPQVALERLINRNRSEESSVTLHYLESIHKRYDQWLLNSSVPVTIIDQNQSLSDTISAANELANRLLLQISQ